MTDRDLPLSSRATLRARAIPATPARTPQSRRRCRAGPHYRRAVGNPRALTPKPQCRHRPAVAGPHPGGAQSRTTIRRGSAGGQHAQSSESEAVESTSSDPRRPRKSLTRRAVPSVGC